MMSTAQEHINDRPTRVNVVALTIPELLKAMRPQWVVWQYELSEKGHWTKVPYQAENPTRRASSTDPKTWATFEEALAAYEKHPDLDGVGFVPAEDDDIVGVDLDHCVSDDGTIEPWAMAIVVLLNSYTEITPSGHGIRIFLKGKLPGRGRKNGNIEVYDRSRYLTVTGHHLPSSPATIEDRQAQLDTFMATYFAADTDDDKILAAALKNEKFPPLWAGDTAGYFSQSEAELAFCSLLAIHKPDFATIDRLYRRSKLYRSKWNEMHGDRTYGQATIEKALAGHEHEEEIVWPELVPLTGCKAPEIPDDILPGWAGDFAQEAARAIQVPYPMAMAATLGAVSLAACAAVQEIQVKPGYSEPLNLYAQAPLPSGERKTGMVDEVNAPLYAYEAEQAEIMGAEIRAAHSRRKTAEKIIEARRNKAAKAKDEDRKALIESIAQDEAALEEVPSLPRLLADDVTPEKLAGLLKDQDELMGIITSEGGFFDIIGGRYSRDGIANLDLFLKGHSREPYRVDRIGRDPIVLSRPRIVACICPQPEVVQRFANIPGFRGRGVVARFLYFYSDSKVGYREVSADPIPDRVKGEYALYIKSLLYMRGKNLVLTLSPAARSAWFSFAERVEVEMRTGGEFEHFRDWAGKLPGQAARLAGLFHCITAQLPTQLEVSEETMRRALKLAAILADHAKVAFDAMGSDPSMETARSILEWIQRTKQTDFTLRECFRDLNGRFHSTAEIRPGLGVLVERGYLIDKGTIPTGGKGRPRGPVYLVNPILGGDA